jgi:hypothetical protein
MIGRSRFKRFSRPLRQPFSVPRPIPPSRKKFHYRRSTPRLKITPLTALHLPRIFGLSTPSIHRAIPARIPRKNREMCAPSHAIRRTIEHRSEHGRSRCDDRSGAETDALIGFYPPRIGAQES